MGNSSILRCAGKQDDFFIWRSILKATNILKEGFMVRIGSGNISVWYDKWMDDGPLCNLIVWVNILDTDLRVKDVWQNNNWNLNTLYTFLPDQLKLKILGVPLVQNSDLDDCIVWSLSASGEYTSKIAYLWLVSNSRVDMPLVSWSWIWKIANPEKIRFFVWLIF